MRNLVSLCTLWVMLIVAINSSANNNLLLGPVFGMSSFKTVNYNEENQQLSYPSATKGIIGFIVEYYRDGLSLRSGVMNQPSGYVHNFSYEGVEGRRYLFATLFKEIPFIISISKHFNRVFLEGNVGTHLLFLGNNWGTVSEMNGVIEDSIQYSRTLTFYVKSMSSIYYSVIIGGGIGYTFKKGGKLILNSYYSKTIGNTHQLYITETYEEKNNAEAFQEKNTLLSFDGSYLGFTFRYYYPLSRVFPNAFN